MQNEKTWRDTMRWWRDEAAALFSTFWLIAVLYGIGGWLAYSFFQLDAQFSRPLAGGVMPPEVTQHLSWAILGFSIFDGMAVIWCHRHKMPVFRNMLSVLGGLAAILLLLHAYGIAAKAMKGQYAAANAITEVQDAQNTSTDATIAILERQKDGIRADRDAAVSRLQVSIDNITSDKLDNDELADAYRADQTKAENDAKTQIAEIDGKVLALATGAGEKNVEATQSSALVDTFNPLFTLMARLSTGTWDPAKKPPEIAEFISGVLFFTLFFGLGKLLMMTLFTTAYAMLLQARENARQGNTLYSEEVPDGMVNINMTEAEWAAYEAAMSVHENIKDGAQKGARTRRRGKKIKNSEEYNREVVGLFMDRRRKGETMENILQSRGLTLGEFLATYNRSIESDDERELLLGEFDEAFDEPVDEDEPENMANGFDHDEPTEGGEDDANLSIGT